jgi:peptide/nickel transport system substrate-binding protein
VRRRFGFALTTAVAAASLVTGCSGGSDRALRGDHPLVVATGGQPDQLDPHKTSAYASFQVLENVYDTLVVPKPDGSGFDPSLATSWQTAADQLSWTFHLREATFSDGTALDAGDVVYSLRRIIDGKLANAFRLEPVTAVTALDPRTVRIDLKRPTPYLLAELGGFKDMAILPAGAADHLNLALQTDGTGPFKLARQTPAGITLVRSDSYWGPQPEITSIEFRQVAEPTAAMVALQTGEVDWTDNVPPQQISALRHDKHVTLGQVPSVDYWYLAPNFSRPPFDDARVRRAIALGLDRAAIAEAAQPHLAVPLQTAIPPGSAWHSDYAPYQRDVQRARDLLAQSGHPRLSMGLMVTSQYPQTVQAAEVIASNLHEVGIDVRVDVEEFATWLDKEGKGEFDTYLLGWLGNIDPFDFYQAQHQCDGADNFQKYCDPATDDLLRQAAAQTDTARRKDLYDQVARRVVDANSYIYLYSPQVVQAWSPKLTGYQIRPDRAVDFAAARLAP